MQAKEDYVVICYTIKGVKYFVIVGEETGKIYIDTMALDPEILLCSLFDGMDYLISNELDRKFIDAEWVMNELDEGDLKESLKRKIQEIRDAFPQIIKESKTKADKENQV